MVQCNRLFLIIFAPVLVGACGTFPFGRDPRTATPRAPVGNSVAPTPAPSGPAIAPSSDSDRLFHALAASGVDYRRGGKSYQSGFDCSGLVAYVYREAYGLALPHNTQAQSRMGDAIKPSDLQPGDLVFFNTQRKPFSHVGIYLGEGRF